MLVMMFVKKYWFEVVEAAAIMVLFFGLMYYKSENNQLQSKVKEKDAYIMAQNIAIASNRTDYETAMKRLPTVLHDINTKYKTEYQTIYAWRDRNETHDCNSSMQYLNSFVF